MEESFGASTGQTKEYFWGLALDKTTKSKKWDGDDSCEMEQLILKLACLGGGAKDGERNVVELISFDNNQEKVTSCICSLSLDGNHSQSLCDICLYPPVRFNLIEGSGPVHIIGNHVLLDELDDDLSDDDDDFEEMEENETIDSEGKIAELEDDEEDDDDEDDSEEESDEEEKSGPAVKKRKTNGKTAVITKNSNEKNATKSPKPSTNGKAGSPQKNAKSPKPTQTIEEVKSLIKKVSGGKPRKEEKFRNWVKNTYKLQEESMIGELWKWHKKECGL